MNWKCAIGIHDWETVVSKSYSTLKHEIKMETRKDKNPICIQYSPDGTFRKKICLRCEKFVDEITPYKNKLREEMYLKHNRKLKAKRLANKR